MSELRELLPALLAGARVTIQLTVLASMLGFGMSILAGVASLAQQWTVRSAARVYVEVFRGTSALVQLFWFFFVLPFFGIRLTPLMAGVLALGLNVGAYGAEIVRGAIRAVPPNQWEAAVALNMSPLQRMRLVILPQAVVSMLPPFGNLLIELLKTTALVSLITLPDLTFQAQVLRASTGGTAMIFSLVLVGYFLLAYAMTLGVRQVEIRVSHGRDIGRAVARSA